MYVSLIMYNNYLKLLSLNHNCHEKKKKDDFVTFLSNLLNSSDASPCSTCRLVEMKKKSGGPGPYQKMLEKLVSY